MPNLSVTTNADFYHNYTQGSGLSIPKILARIIGMRTVPSRPDSPTCEEKNKQEMSRNNWNSKQWSMCQTQTILRPLYQGCIIIDTIQYWCYHITHHSSPSQSVFISFYPKVPGCCSLQLGSPAVLACTTLASPSWRDTRIYSHHSLAQIRTYFRNFQQNKICRYWGRRRNAPSAGFQDSNRHHFSKNWKTGNCLVTTMKSHWILESWETIESNLTIKPTMSEEEEEWM